MFNIKTGLIQGLYWCLLRPWVRVLEGWLAGKGLCFRAAKEDWTNTGEMLVTTGLDTERGRGGGVMEKSIGLENDRIFLEGGISIPGCC